MTTHNLTSIQKYVIDKLDGCDRLFWGDEGFFWESDHDESYLEKGPNPKTVRSLESRNLIKGIEFEPYGEPYYSEWVLK